MKVVTIVENVVFAKNTTCGNPQYKVSFCGLTGLSKANAYVFNHLTPTNLIGKRCEIEYRTIRNRLYVIKVVPVE